jgi:hypothetical protein
VYELDLSTTAPPDATAVVMNVTAADSTANGFVTVYPCDIARPTASNLNYTRAQVVPNLVTVALAASAKVCFYTHTPTHIIADLSGWYVLGAGTGYQAQAPVRLFDTRSGAGAAPVPAGGVYTVDLTDDVLATAEAVTMNVTVVDPAAAGFLTVYPCDAPRPLASNLNFVAGQTVPNLVTVQIGAGRAVCLHANAPTNLVVDVAGWYAAAGKPVVAVTPTRLLDTRDGTGGWLNPLAAGQTIDLGVAGTVGIPGGAGAVVLNVTATGASAGGYVTVFPCGSEPPLASNLNVTAGETVANAVLARLGDGAVCFYASTPVHLVVDVAGYVTA